MPISSRDSQLRQNLKQSQRLANAAVAKALSEAPPELVAKLKEEGFSPRVRLSSTTKTASVTALKDVVTFGVTDMGKLTVNRLGAARHEVSHLVGSGHLAIAASPGGARFAGSLGNSQGIRQSIGAQRLTGSQKISRALTTRKRVESRVKTSFPVSRARGRGLQIKLPTDTSRQGFSTSQGQKVLRDPNSSRRALRTAKAQAFKSAVRAKNRGIDF